MKRVLTAAVLIPLVLLLVFKAPPWLMALVLALIVWLCLREYFTLVRAHGIEPFARLTTAAVLACFLLPLLFYLVPFHPYLRLLSFETLGLAFVGAVLVLAPFVLVAAGMARADLRSLLPAAAASLFALLYLGASLLTLWALWLRPFGALLVTFVLVVVWAGDIAAYFVGRSFGRRKLAPRISPQKTWEGALASLAASVLLGTLVLSRLPYLLLDAPAGGPGLSPGLQLPLWFILLAAALINLAAQLGDLVESALKRGAGLKDSGAILPGHGGMLDRIDALLFASPVALLVFLAWTLLA